NSISSDFFAPQIEVQAALNDKASYNVLSSNNNFDIVTSAEIVEFTLPAFDKANDYAQVDIDYLVVEQHYNGGFKYFINYPYNAQGGERLDVDSEHVKNNYNDASKLVSRTISLDTKLVRDASGKVDVTKLDIPLYYTIKIRYKLSNSASMRGDEFANCYYYYANGNRVEYYESTYTISIDRVAPANNIKYLEEHDALAKYYYAEGKSSLFAQSVTENNSGLYFANTYINRDLQNLYAFVVTDQTPFDTTDIAAVYYNVFENVGDLHWAPSQIPDGRQANLYGVTTFGDLNFGEYSTYVEILELDKAGNTAQYLVYYCTSDETEGGGYNISDSYFNVKLTIGARQYTSTGLDDKDTELTFNVHDVDKTFTVYSVRADSEFGNIYRGSNETFYYFALIDLHTSQTKFVYKTNGKTNFGGLEVPTAIVNGIEAAGPGNYKFVILTQDARKNYSAIFDYYSSTDYSIDARDLVSTDRTTITLNKANKVIDNITYYAREIRINENGVINTYKCVPENGQYNYYLFDASQGKTVGNPVVDIRTKKDSTYQLTTIDVFGDISNYRFSTAEGGDEFIKIESTSPMFEFSQVFYAFDATTIKFDTNIYTIK
ncbi:MAG: hypothetical protein MJ152_03520, partial [Clostridia bacterium]|nr:hypothetical protein [Clostridia bacterium]